MPIEEEALKKKKDVQVDFREISLTGSQIYHGMGTVDYNPDSLVGKKGLEIYSKMREDDQVKAVLTMKKYARMMTSWEIQPASQDAIDVELAEFVKTNFDNIAGTFEDCLLNILTALDYGFSVTEKLWYRIEKGKFAGKIGLKGLKTREPFYYGFESDVFGNLKPDGLLYLGPTPIDLKNQVENQIASKGQFGYRLPIDKFIVYSYNKEFSNWYGRSDLRSAYRSWWSKEILIRFMNIYMERFGMPTHVATVPKSYSKDDRTAVKSVIDKVQAKYGIVVPEDVVISLLQTATGGGEAYRSAIEMHNKFISRSILVPDLMGYNEIGAGAYALGKKHFDVFLWILQKLGRDVEETIVGEQIIKQLVDYNYSNVENYPKFKFESITAEGTQTRASIVQMGVAGGFINPEEEWIREYLAIPKADPSKPLGLPAQQIPGAATGLKLPTGTEKPETTEGLKDKEEITTDELLKEGEGDFKVSKEYMQAIELWKVKKFASLNFIDIAKVKPNAEQFGIVDHNKVASMKAVLDRGEDLTPVVLDKECNLLNGHHRLIAYKKACRDKIPYIVSEEIANKFAKSDLPKIDNRFAYKVNFTQMKNDLDEYEAESVDSLSKIVELQKDALLRTVERKSIVENKDYSAIDSLQLRFVGDFKRELEQRLVKLYLDSKLEALLEVEKGSDDIEVVTKFASGTVQNWIPVPPTDAIDFFNRKVTAKVIDKKGIKKLLVLATRKELDYYDSKAFAIAGIERDNILKQAKLILLNGLRNGSNQKEVMFGLEQLFTKYLVTGVMQDDELITPARLETIVRTNFSEAMNMGRKNMMDDPDLADFVPYRQYSAIMDDRVRESHAAMHGRIYKSTNPIWDTILPPNGFNCRCTVIPITKLELKRMIGDDIGIATSDGDPLPANFPDQGFGKYTSILDCITIDVSKFAEDDEFKLVSNSLELLRKRLSDKDMKLTEFQNNQSSLQKKIANLEKMLNSKMDLESKVKLSEDKINSLITEKLSLQDMLSNTINEHKGKFEQITSEKMLLNNRIDNLSKNLQDIMVRNKMRARSPEGVEIIGEYDRVERCPYPNCGSDNIEIQNEKDGRLITCKDCNNQSKVNNRGQLYFFDKGQNTWMKQYVKVNDIVRCPYPNCGVSDVSVIEDNAELGLKICLCGKCNNLFKVLGTGEVYLYDKGLNKWIKEDMKAKPNYITGER